MAMEPEVAALRTRMTNVVESREHGLLLERGDLGGRPVTAVLCGIGKVAAAAAATVAAVTEQPSVLLSAGVAGGVRPDIATGSLVVVSGAVEHDYDLRPFVPDRAHGFGGPRAWSADATTVAALHDAARRTGHTPVHDAWTATGDHVVTEREKHGPILELGPEVACVDMETSALAYVATSLGLPWAGLRVISDGADEHLDVDPVLSRALDAGVLLADVLEHYLSG
jgi:adenosylhomocysteine nucleosidase